VTISAGFVVLEVDLPTLADGKGSVSWVDMLSLLASMAPSLCLLENASDPRRIASTSFVTIPIQSIF
jgi:hypothetical protein